MESDPCRWETVSEESERGLCRGAAAFIYLPGDATRRAKFGIGRPSRLRAYAEEHQQRDEQRRRIYNLYM